MSKAVYKFSPSEKKPNEEAIAKKERRISPEDTYKRAYAEYVIARAQKRGPTFRNPLPGVGEILVNESGTLKPLSESCSFSIDDLDD